MKQRRSGTDINSWKRATLRPWCSPGFPHSFHLDACTNIWRKALNIITDYNRGDGYPVRRQRNEPRCFLPRFVSLRRGRPHVEPVNIRVVTIGFQRFSLRIHHSFQNLQCAVDDGSKEYSYMMVAEFQASTLSSGSANCLTRPRPAFKKYIS